jgi:circadian clock protein KaiC
MASAVPHSDRASTGIEGLDNILGGGFPRHRIYLIEGDPGAGKTTLALQFLLQGAAEGEEGLYVTLSETPEELQRVSESHAWDLSRLHICDLAASEESLRADAQYTLFHPSEVELGETTETILAEVERIQPARVVIDSLSEVRLLARDPLRYRRQILALKRYFAGRKITVLLLNDRQTEVGDTQLPTLVYGVCVLENLSPAYGAERRQLRVTKLRGSSFRGGNHDFILKKGGMEVYPRLVASEYSSDYEREKLSSGIVEFDDLVGGGLDRGTSTLIHGPTGSGKSTLAVQYCIAAAERGETSFLYLFDENRNTLYMRSESLGLPLKEWVDKGMIHIVHVNPSEITPGGFAHQVQNSVEKEDAKIVVIDSLNGYMYAMPEERFLTAHLHELFSYLNQQGVLTLSILAQHGIVGDMTMSGSPFDVSYVADTVITVRFFEAAGRIHKALSVMKNRSGPHETTIRELKIGPEGLKVGEPLLKFRGILTGTPQYADAAEILFESEGDKR